MRNKFGMVGALGFMVLFGAMEEVRGDFLGAEGLMVGALPPPGQYLENYSMYYRAEESLNFVSGSETIKGRVFADLVHFVNVTDLEILGGIWAQQLSLAFLHNESVYNNVRSKDTGLGNVVVDPILVGWHCAPFHWLAGVDTSIPYYNNTYTSSFIDMSQNCWTFEPFVGVTYLNEDGQELSTKLMYDFHTRYMDMDYTPGQMVLSDFVAAQHFGPWAAGIGGYWYSQTTAARMDGWSYDYDFARQVALGPQVSYEYCAMNFSLAWDHELNDRNRMQGDRVWLKVMIPL